MLADLDDTIASNQQRAFLHMTAPKAMVGDTLLLTVPDAFTRDVIESRMRPALTEALRRHLHRTVQIAVTIRPADDDHRVVRQPPSAAREVELADLIARPAVARQIAAVLASAQR